MIGAVIGTILGGASSSNNGVVSAKMITVANSPYQILTTDDDLYVDTTGGAVTLIMPNPTVFTGSKTYVIIDSKNKFDVNNVTLQRNGTEKIDNYAGDKTLSAIGGRYTVSTDMVDWFVR